MTSISGKRGRVRGRLCLAVVVLCAFSAAPAWAHTERAGYWPDPRPDCSLKP
jgi:hypothetical protein